MGEETMQNGVVLSGLDKGAEPITLERRSSGQAVGVGDDQATGQMIGALRAIVIIVVFFLAQFVVGIVLGAVVGAYFGITRGISDPSTMSAAIAPFIMPIGIAGVIVAGLITFRMTRRTLSGAIGQGAFVSIGWRPSDATTIFTAALAGCVLSFVYLVFIVPFHPPAEGQQFGPLAASADAGGWPLFLWAVLALMLAPPIEEFLFRGVLFSGLSNALGTYAAALITCFVFVGMHAKEALGYWPVCAALCMLAGTTLLFRIKTQSLLPAVAVHVGYNLILVAAVCLHAS
jgi:membrane protease YdiL (CAAX protease family)